MKNELFYYFIITWMTLVSITFNHRNQQSKIFKFYLGYLCAWGFFLMFKFDPAFYK